METHGNSKKSEKPHHLYEIIDTEVDDTFKFGISGDSIESHGLSSRIKEQIDWGNLIAGFVRFVAKILLTNIPGRKRALEIEDEHIEAYFKEHGRYPPGNRNKKPTK